MGDNPYEDMINRPRTQAPVPRSAEPAAPRQPWPGSTGGSPYEAIVSRGPQRPSETVQRRPAEMRSADYSPRDVIGNMSQDALIKLGMSPYDAGHIGRGLRDVASLAPPIGAAISGADTGYYAGQGDPAMATVSAIGMMPGATMARRGMFGMPQRILAPSEGEVGAATTRAYDRWRQAPIVYSPDAMTEAVNEITRSMIQNGADPSLKRGALDIGLGMRRQTGMNNNDFELLRRHLDGGSTGSERYAGRIAKDALEQYMMNPPAQHVRQGTPQDIATARRNLLEARGNAAAGFRSDVISGKETIADIAEERGGDFTKAFRNRMGTLSNESPASERVLRGFSDPERERIRNEVAGRLLERGTGSFGRALDNSSTKAGLGIAAAAGAAPWLTGGALGLDPLAAGVVGLGIAGGGKIAGKGLQDYSTNIAKQSAADLSASLRMRSPLAEGDPRFGIVTDPSAAANDARKYLMYPWLRQEGEDYVEGQRTPYENR